MNRQKQKFYLKDVVAVRKEVGIFTFERAQNHASMHAFSRYLHFYKLPPQTDETSINAGTTEDGQIVIVAWRPLESLGTAVIVHGYMDHIGLYGHLIQELLNRKLTILCFDAKGHGLSEGKSCSITYFSEYVESLKEIIALAQQHCGGPLHAVGQSMGGAVLMKHLLNEDNETESPFTSINLLAPLLQPRGWKLNRCLYHLTRPLVTSIKREFRPSSWDKAFLNFLKYSDPLQPERVPLDWVGAMDQWMTEFGTSLPNYYPIHIIQGNQDKTLDWVYNIEQFKQKFPAASLSLIENANHHLVNESEPLRKHIFDALKI